MSDERANRRLTTILAADIAGYSRLVRQEEEGTVAFLRRVRGELVDPLLAKWDGRIANTAGDSLLVEFSSVVSALRFALALQADMATRNADRGPNQRMEFRIGINVGDVIVDGDDLLGDGVNVAARLEGVASPGGICISRSARDQVRHLTDIALLDLGEVAVKNIARPVRAFSVLADGQTQPDVARGRRWLWFPGSVACATAMIVAVIWYTGLAERIFTIAGLADRPVAMAELRPALIVLPLVNMSDDPAQDYFSDGLTEDITSALARTPGMLVVARNTAFTYKGRSVDARQLGEDLGVRYALEGSARKLGDRVRLNVQLIETEGGTHVWAETYNRPLEDIFTVQDELVDRIVGSVTSRLRRHEGERTLRASPETLLAYDLTSRARLLFRENTFDSISEARRLLKRAIEIDPNYAEAHSRLAQVENYFFTSRVSEEYASGETAARVIAAAARGAALAPEDAGAHAVNGMALRLVGDYEEAAREARRARELAPNDPDVLAELSSILVGVGDYEGAVATVRTAQALDPYVNPLHVGVLLAQALFALSEFEASRAAAEYCLKRTPRDVRCHESLVRALGEMGPPEAARAAVDRLLELSPDYTVSEYKRRASRNRQDTAAIDRWANGLRKAGLPE